MLLSLIDQLSSFISPGISPIPVQIKFDRYVHWLETKLLLSSTKDVIDLDETIDQIVERIIQLKNITAQGRSVMVAPNNAHANKVYKMFDQIESLGAPYEQGRLFPSAGKYPIPSLLPDIDTLNEWVSLTKAKLKSMEEVVSSKKNDTIKFKGSKSLIVIRGEIKKQLDMSMIRSEIRGILLLMDKLTVKVIDRAGVLKYFGQIKESVHFPLQDFSIKLRTIPPMKEASAHLENEINVLNSVEASYRTARGAVVLVSAAKARRDASYIEYTAEDAIRNLRGLGSEEVYQFLGHIYSLNKVSALAGCDVDVQDNDAAVPPWLYNLRQLAELSNEQILNICSPSGGKAQDVLADVRQVKDLVETATKLGNNTALLSSMSEDMLLVLERVDAELVCAYAADRDERMTYYTNLTKMPEFVTAYDRLCEGRRAYEKAHRSYQNALFHFNNVLSLHREATQQLNELKERFAEIALTELSENIEFV